jgi:ATP-dependent DNA helicase
MPTRDKRLREDELPSEEIA